MMQARTAKARLVVRDGDETVVVIVGQQHGVNRDTLLLISHAHSLLTLTQCYQDDPRGAGGSGDQQVFKEEKKIDLWRTQVYIYMSKSDHIINVEKDLKDYLLFMYLPTSGANKLGRSYLCVSEAFKLISVHLDMFYLITLGLTISKWGEPTLWVKAVKN